MVIVDDCSPESPDRHLPDNPGFPIRVARTPRRSGPGAARNIGIREARGSLIAFLDADDLWAPTKIARQVQLFLDQPDAHWVYTDALYLRDGETFHKTHFGFVGLTNGPPEGRALNTYHLRGFNFVTMSCTLIDKAVLNDVGGFDETLKIAEDWDLYTRIAERYPVHVINEPLSSFRLKPSGAHNRFIEEYEMVATDILQRLYTRQSLLPERHAALADATARIYLFLGIQHLNAGQFTDARRALFHPKIAPLRLTLKVMALRLLSLLPPACYRAGVWLYSRM